MTTINRCSVLTLFLLVLVGPACREVKPANAREYTLEGEVLRIKADRTEITIKHGDIKGFMPAMTMPFPIKNPTLLNGLGAGDLVKATLVVTDDESYLSAITRTGTLPPDRRSTGQPVLPEALIPGSAVPDIDLIDEGGAALKLSSYRGRYVLFTFIYTRCPLPDYCPRMNRYFAAVQRAIAQSPALQSSIRLLSISFDPEHDTPQVLKSHAKMMGADPKFWRFTTAPGRKVDSFGATLGLSVTRDGPNGENISHNLRTALMDRNGILVKTYTGNDWSPDAVVRDVEALIASGSRTRPGG